MGQETLRLFRAYINHDLRPDDERLLRRFINESKDNRRLFNDFVALYKVEMQRRAARHIDTDRAWNAVVDKIERRRKSRRRMLTAAAAAVLLLVAVPATLFLARTKTPSMDEVCKAEPVDRVIITLSSGEQVPVETNAAKTVTDGEGNIVCENDGRRIVFKLPAMQTLWKKVSVNDGSTYEFDLFDGSVAHVNSNSELSFSDNRSVSLSGEAYFEVKRNERVPFTVNCAESGVKVAVLGTKFNVSARKGQPVVVTLAEGCVRVVAPQGEETLLPGEQLTVNGGAMEKTAVNSELYTSWAKGMYDFTEASMDDIIRQLSLWYGVSFRFATPALKGRTYTGAILKYKPLGYTLDILREVSNISFEMQDGVIVVKESDKTNDNIQI